MFAINLIKPRIPIIGPVRTTLDLWSIIKTDFVKNGFEAPHQKEILA